MLADIFAYIRTYQYIKRCTNLKTSSHILVRTGTYFLPKYVLVRTGMYKYRYIVVYRGTWQYKAVYLYTLIYRAVQTRTYQYIPLWARYMGVHTGTYCGWLICFLLHPPGWPARVLNICCCHCSVTRHTSSSTMVFTFLVLLPPPRHPLSWEGGGLGRGSRGRVCCPPCTAAAHAGSSNLLPSLWCYDDVVAPTDSPSIQSRIHNCGTARQHTSICKQNMDLQIGKPPNWRPGSIP